MKGNVLRDIKRTKRYKNTRDTRGTKRYKNTRSVIFNFQKAHHEAYSN